MTIGSPCDSLAKPAPGWARLATATAATGVGSPVKGMQMKNVQRRVIPAPPQAVSVHVERIAERTNTVWPSHAWPPLLLDHGLTPGSAGGHGPIKYSVTEHESGDRIRFGFKPGAGLDGWHEFGSHRPASRAR